MGLAQPRPLSEASPSSDQELLGLYRSMLRIRHVEEEIAARYAEWRMRCPVHLCIGQEATAVGVCNALRPTDAVFSNHRAHGHYLAKGGGLKALVAELYGKAGGCAGGRGGSMHLIDRAAGFLGATPIVGGTVPLAVGAAWAARLQGRDQVVAVFFGDGCFEEGVLHESMNFAVLHHLPVLFVCEDNDYSVYTPRRARQPDRPIRGIAAAHGMDTHAGDGNDVTAVLSLARRCAARARAGAGPQFLELATYRWLEHCGPNEDDHLGYRPQDEPRHWRERCPLGRARDGLRRLGADPDAVEVLEAEVREEVEAAFAFAESCPPPAPGTLGQGTLGPPPVVAESAGADVPRLEYGQAIREALEGAMDRDPSVVLVGEGVPDPKGIFGTTSGLAERFGPQRVFDSPLAENAMTGICIGAALNGLRPVMTHQRIDFALLAMDQIVNNAAKWRYLFGEGVPLVVRLVVGRGWGQGPQHGQSLQALFGHVPGLRVLMPATPADAKGMLGAALRADDPVIFIEHRWLHPLTGEVPAGPHLAPLAGARVLRPGSDLTLAAFSHMVAEAMKAAAWLERQGVSVEVIDMRCVSPLDSDRVVSSVRRTGRLLVADTGHRKGGVAVDLVAAVAVEALEALRATPVILALPDHPLPTSHHLADLYYPDAADIAGAALGLCGLGHRATAAAEALRRPGPRDQPEPGFNGPF